jgi:hypothetical protein
VCSTSVISLIGQCTGCSICSWSPIQMIRSTKTRLSSSSPIGKMEFSFHLFFVFHFVGRKMNVADPGSLSRNRIFFHPGSASKNKSILTQKLFLSSRKYYQGCSSGSRSRILDPDSDFLPIPDPDVGGMDPRTGSTPKCHNVTGPQHCLYFMQAAVRAERAEGDEGRQPQRHLLRALCQIE